VLTQKAKELALIPELEVSGVCSSGWLTNFKKPWHQLSGHGGRSAPGQRPACSPDRSKLLEALPDKDGENPVNVQPEDTFNMDESGLYYGQQPSRTLARGRTAGNKKDKKRMTVALTVNATGTQQLKPIIIHTAQKPRAFPKNRGVCSECALASTRLPGCSPQSSRTGSGRYACTQPLDDLASDCP
jgi:hypothetical protein